MNTLTIRQRISLIRLKHQIRTGQRDEGEFSQHERKWLAFYRWLREEGCLCDCTPCECETLTVFPY